MLKLIDRARARFPATENFKITQSLIDEIIVELRSSKANPVRIATKLGVPIALIRYITNETPSSTGNFTAVSDDGWGRPELRDFIVTRKQASSSEWDKADEALIQQTRDRYDAGEIEMAQGRDSNFIIQYAFPRSRMAKRLQPYFKLEEEIAYGE